MRIVGTDSNGGVLYEVRKRRRQRTRYEQGPAAADDSPRYEPNSPSSARVSHGRRRRSDGPAGRESGERDDQDAAGGELLNVEFRDPWS